MPSRQGPEMCMRRESTTAWVNQSCRFQVGSKAHPGACAGGPARAAAAPATLCGFLCHAAGPALPAHRSILRPFSQPSRSTCASPMPTPCGDTCQSAAHLNAIAVPAASHEPTSPAGWPPHANGDGDPLQLLHSIYGTGASSLLASHSVAAERLFEPTFPLSDT